MSPSKSLISGVGQSAVGRRLPRSGYQLTIDAIEAAVADAGLSIDAIDGLATFPGDAVGLNPGYIGPDLYDVQDGLGLELNWHLATPQGAAQAAPIIEAALAVHHGLCKHAVVYRTMTEASAQGSGRRGPIDHPIATDGILTWLLTAGAMSPTNFAGLYAQRYMHEYGVTKEQLGWVALSAREHAQRNPLAILRGPLTMDDYLASRVISSPLSLFDCDIAVDGATAVVVSAPDTAADLRHWAEIEAMGTAMRHRPFWEHWPDLTTMAAHDAAAHMWAQTALKPADVDLAQLYDGFSIFTLLWLEAFGFCPRGGAGSFVEGGKRIGLDGELPLNTAGGQLSGGRLHGFGFVAEALRQLWGEAGERQVRDVEVVAVGLGGGVLAGTLLLTKGDTRS